MERITPRSREVTKKTQRQENMADNRGVMFWSPLSVLICLLISQFSIADDTPGILDDCKKSCERSYPQHTYPKEEPLQACKQGCRLSAIEQLAGSYANRGNANQSCVTGCQESYQETESVYACNVGCKSQDVIPSPESYMEEESPDQWSVTTYMLFSPVMDVRRYCSGFMNRVTYYYQQSTAYYYSTPEGESVVVEINEIPYGYVGSPRFGEDIDYLESDEPEANSYYNHYDDDSSYSTGVFHKGHRWLQCVSRRSGLPLWLLTSTLFLSIFFLMWLCCATASTAPKEKSKKAAAVIGELLYLDEKSLLEKMPLVRANEEEDEAGPIR